MMKTKKTLYRPIRTCGRRLISCSIFLTLINLGTMSAFFAYSSREMHEECRQINAGPQCRCNEALGDFKIFCPTETETKITLTIRPNNYARIECNRLNAAEYNLLPRMTVGKVGLVQLRHCPLPGNMPVERILHHLNASGVNQLIYESSDLGGNLTRGHLSKLEGIRRLRLSSNRLSHIPNDLFVDLSQITWLDMHTNRVELPPNIFTPLGNLTMLELGHNNLKTLPSGLFRQQRQLKHLNLWGNQLRNITKESFQGLQSLRVLDLSSNGLERLDSNVFELLSNLSDINLNGNHLSELPVNLFAQNHELLLFSLTDNQVPMKCPAALFADLPHLKEVLLTCAMDIIPEDVFVNSSAITNITISGNKLKELPNKLLTDQSNLLNFDVSQNQLVSLPLDIFENCRNLLVLKLSHNEINEIPGKLFEPLVNLETLFLDNNRLKSIDDSVFEFTKNLKFLDMTNNKINLSISSPTAKSSLQHLSALRVLNLRNNSIERIPANWRENLRALLAIDLSYNNLSTLDSSEWKFSTDENLTMNLSHNALQTITFNNTARHLDATQKFLLLIDLNFNPMHCDCTLLSFVQYLRGEMRWKLENRLKMLADSLRCATPQRMKSKRVLELSPKDLLCPLDTASSNVTRRCPDKCGCWVRPYDHVLLLNCSYNDRTEVPSLPILRELNLNSTILYMEHNRLRQLPQSKTPGYADVTRLYLAHNQLTSITAQNLPLRLTHLDISHNQLQFLNDSEANFCIESHSLLSLKLSYNPWICNCNAATALQHFIQSSQVLISDYNDMQCHDPHTYNVTQPKRFKIGEVCPVQRNLIIVITVLITSVGCFISAIMLLFYKYEQQIKTCLYAHHIPCLPFRIVEKDTERNVNKYDAFIAYTHNREEHNSVAEYAVHNFGDDDKLELIEPLEKTSTSLTLFPLASVERNTIVRKLNTNSMQQNKNNLSSNNQITAHIINS